MPSTVATDIYQGMDVTLQMSGPRGPLTVGGFQTARFALRHTARPYAELNEQWDLQLPGKFAADGTTGRGWQDPQALQAILGGQASIGRGIRTVLPKFTLTMTISAPGKAANGKRLQLVGCTSSQLTWDLRSAEAEIANGIDFVAEGLQWL